MKTSKRITICMSICTLIGIAVSACSSGQGTTEQTTVGTQVQEEEEKVAGEELPWDIEPLETPVTLRIGYHTASTMHTPTYIAEEKGWLEQLNIQIETIPFANGPDRAQISAKTVIIGAGNINRSRRRILPARPLNLFGRNRLRNNIHRIIQKFRANVQRRNRMKRADMTVTIH